jgi:soluble lytic murein transglycosylase-like protein
MARRILQTALRYGRGRLSAASVGTTVALGLLVGTVYAGAPAEPVPDAGGVRAEGEAAGVSAEPLEGLEDRVRRLAGGWAELEDYYQSRVAPIERVLRRYGAAPDLAEQIAVALVREANRAGLEPRLLLAVLLVENPWLDPRIRSPVGAVGLMQVMPFHRGRWAGCEPDLEDVDANICHGARIFAAYFRETGGNVERALLRYNGCVRGTNTPNCHQYPYHVFARAGRASVLAWLSPDPEIDAR